MAVAYDAFGNSSVTSTGSPITHTHTPVGTPRGVVVAVSVTADGTDTIGDVTYGGSSMTEVTGSPLLYTATAEHGGVHVFFLGSSVPTGAQTVSVVNTGATSRQVMSWTVTADDDTEVENTATIATQENSPSTGLAVNGNVCWVGQPWVSGAGTVGSVSTITGQSVDLETDHGVMVSGGYRFDSVSSNDVTIGFSQSNDEAIIFGVAITESAGGGGGGTKRHWHGATLGAGRF